MKKLLLNVVMCVLAMAGSTQGAWAESTLVYGRALIADEANGYTAWSASDVATSGTGTNVWIGSFGFNGTYGLYVSANGNRSSVMTFPHTENAKQTIEIV